MVEPSVEELQAHLQANLNCLELCRAFEKQTDDLYVKESLGLMIDDLQASLAALARHLRRRGVAPGTHELDRQGRARIRDVLAVRALREQLLAVRRDVADLVAWCAAHTPADDTDQATRDLLESLSAQARHMLEEWDQHLDEMKATQ